MILFKTIITKQMEIFTHQMDYIKVKLIEIKMGDFLLVKEKLGKFHHKKKLFQATAEVKIL
jgi:hypothetical protein